jgi:hypothetical protein
MHDVRAEKLFHRSVVKAYIDAARNCGMREARYKSMVDEQGAVRAAKRILGSNQFVFRATELVKSGHAEYSMEYLVLKPEFAGLFTEQERLIARTRLNRGRKVRFCDGTPGPMSVDSPRDPRMPDRRKRAC